MKFFTALTGAALALALGLSAMAAQDAKAQDAKAVKAQDAAATSEAMMIAEQLPTYPLMTCMVSGESLTEMGEPFDMMHEGRLVRFCCKGCVKGFKKDPAAHMAKVDAAIVEAQLASYPLTDCPLSGNALGEKNEPVNVFHGTRLLRLCCEGCIKSYEKDPAASVAALDAAYIAAQLPNYKAKNCPVSGEALGSMGEPIDMLYGNTLVRLCCKGCVKGFKKDPATHMATLHGEMKAGKPATKAGKKG